MPGEILAQTRGRRSTPGVYLRCVLDVSSEARVGLRRERGSCHGASLLPRALQPLPSPGFAPPLLPWLQEGTSKAVRMRRVNVQLIFRSLHEKEMEGLFLGLLVVQALLACRASGFQGIHCLFLSF